MVVRPISVRQPRVERLASIDTVPDLLLQQALYRPDAVAIEGRDRRWNFGELLDDCTALADRLRCAGCTPTTRSACSSNRPQRS